MRHDPHPLRVVHYPDDPDDWGVVVRDIDGTLTVVWHDGHLGQVHRPGSIDEGLMGRRRLPTVTRDRAACRRALRWGWAALEQYETAAVAGLEAM